MSVESKNPGGSYRRAAAASLLLTMVLSGCADVAYYWQAARGQWEILAKRRPIGEVLEDPATGEPAKTKLRLVLEVQEFAATALAEPREGHYRYYADLGRPFVSWLVVAAPELELREHTWCYWVAGCLGYRGFFAKADADALARELAAQGLDVAVRPVRAYSTLGWFDDPVLNTFLDQDDVDVAATIIHELAHRRVWVKGDTTFNESLAAFVEREGLRRYTEARQAAGGEALWRRYTALQAERDRFMALVMHTRERLMELYASPLGTVEKRARKAALIAEFKAEYQKQRAAFRLVNYDGWFAQPLNNAHLAGIAQYHSRQEAFRVLFERQGRDFARFFAAAEAIGKLPPGERNTQLDRLEAEGGREDGIPSAGNPRAGG